MKTDRLKSFATAEKPVIQQKNISYREAMQMQKIENLRMAPQKKEKHTINGLANEILADFLELCLEENKSQTIMLKDLIEQFKGGENEK